MMDALLLNRVEFVKLLLENGVSLKKFLTINRLEKLYNAVSLFYFYYKKLNFQDSSNLSTLSHLCTNTNDGQITLPEIGVAIEKLMGNAYRSTYTTREFKNHYEKVKGKQPHQNFHFRLNKSSENLLVSVLINFLIFL